MSYFVDKCLIMKENNTYSQSSPGLEDFFVKESKISYGLSGLDLIQFAREGVLKDFLLRLAQRLSFSMVELSDILHVSERTLQRYHKKDIMKPEISERALLLAQLYRSGVDALGSEDNFNDWMRTPLPVFGQNTPLSLLDTSFGFELVSEELGRIAHGVFA